MSRRLRSKRSIQQPLPQAAATARIRHVWLVVVALLALSVRLWHLHQVSRAPFYDLLLGDAAAYDTWARTIAYGNWIGDKVFYQAPLYPYFLAALYVVVGHSIAIAKYIQA